MMTVTANMESTRTHMADVHPHSDCDSLRSSFNIPSRGYKILYRAYAARMVAVKAYIDPVAARTAPSASSIVVAHTENFTSCTMTLTVNMCSFDPVCLS